MLLIKGTYFVPQFHAWLKTLFLKKLFSFVFIWPLNIFLLTKRLILPWHFITSSYNPLICPGVIIVGICMLVAVAKWLWGLDTLVIYANSQMHTCAHTQGHSWHFYYQLSSSSFLLRVSTVCLCDKWFPLFNYCVDIHKFNYTYMHTYLHSCIPSCGVFHLFLTA